MGPALLASLRRHLPLFVLLPLGLTLAVLVQGRPGPASYVSTTTVYVSVRADTDARDVNRGALFIQRQLSSYAALARSIDVLAPVIDKLDLPISPTALSHRVSVGPASGSVLRVSVRGGSSREVLTLSSAISTALASNIETISPRDGGRGPAVSAQVLGSTSYVQTAGYPWLLAALAAIAGLIVATVTALYRFGTGQRIHTSADVREITIAPVFAELGRWGRDAATDEREIERLAYGVRTAATTAGIDVIIVADTAPGRQGSDITSELTVALSYGNATCVAIDPTMDREELSSSVARAREAHDLVLVSWPRSHAGTDLLPAIDARQGLLAVVTNGRTPVSSLVTALRTAEERDIEVLGVVTVTSTARHHPTITPTFAERTIS